MFFFFKETKQVSLEDIDLLFGERALGTLPDDLHKGPIQGVNEINQAEPSPAATDTQVEPKAEGEAV